MAVVGGVVLGPSGPSSCKVVIGVVVVVVIVVVVVVGVVVGPEGTW